MAIASRRTVMAGGVALAMLATKGQAMGIRSEAPYGMIGGFRALPGKRAELAAILLANTGAGMPGCLSYIIAEDVADADLLWISEIWDSKANHDASLKLPQVQAAIAKGRPLIAGFQKGGEMRVLGGIGMPAS